MTQALLVGAFVVTLAAQAAGQGDRPCLTVARATKAPTLDGRLDPDEWREAAVIGGLLTPGQGSVSEPGTLVYVTYADSALYVAVRCLESGRTYPRGFVRAHDDHVWEDDCVQVFVAPEDPRQAKQASIAFGGYEGAYDTWYADIQAYYELTVNCQGSTSEARNDVRDWDAPWEAKVSRDDGGWTAEIAIPFTSLGIARAPQDVFWGLNVFRNRPPDLAGWACPPFGGYTPLPLGGIRLAGDSPVVRQPVVHSPGIGAGELAFGVRNGSGRPVEVEAVVAASGATETRVLSLAAGGAGDLRVPYALNGEGLLRATYVVRLRGEETPLLSGFVPLTVPASLGCDLRYYALPGRVEATVHLGPGSTATKAVLTLPREGRAAETRQADLDQAQGAVLTLPVAGAGGDKLAARLQVLDAAGSVLAERKRDLTIPPRPAWIGTQAGLPLGVLPPWTPIKVEGKRVEMLGKRLVYTDSALPAQVQSAGADMLAAPMRMTVMAGGREVAWQSRSCRVVERAPDHVKLESEWRGDGLILRVASTVEYDGFSWNEVTLTPKEGAAVDRVSLDIPLRQNACRYVYQGHAQAAGAISPLGLRRPIAQDLWVGDESRGLAFLAESLEWVQAKDRARQVEIVPQGDGWLWRSTFIDTATPLTAPYTARFALHVTPAKPVSLRKSRIFHGAYYGLESAHSRGLITVPAKGHINLAQGTLEFWAKPTFDPNESYEGVTDLSRFNRQFFALVTGANEALMLYYNADDRSFRAVTHNSQGQYPVVLGGRARLPAGQWSYVGLSWGDTLRLSVNGVVSELEVKGTVSGDISTSTLGFDVSDFEVDEIRLSRSPRPLEAVPAAEFTADDAVFFLDHCEACGTACTLVPGRFGRGIGTGVGTELDRLAREGKRIVIFHENWSRYQGYTDLEQVPKLKALAEACHARGMLFLVYFCQMMSDAAPEWPGLRDDFMVPPGLMWYHRDDVKQDCWVSCVNGPYGELLLDGIAKLADEAGIDGVYMDGTTVPWDCANPTHPGCGEYLGDGTYRAHQPIRATREFMKRLRSIFAQRRKAFFLDAHTGGAINVATQSFCDGYFDGEHLARYRPGFRLSPDTFLTAYMGKQFGFRGEFLPNRHTTDEALAISLVHDTATRGEPSEVDEAWSDYEDRDTRYLPYWERSELYTVAPGTVLGSLYLKRDCALLVLGSQTEQPAECQVGIARLLRLLPPGVEVCDAITGEALASSSGALSLPLSGRGWRMIEIKQP